MKGLVALLFVATAAMAFEMCPDMQKHAEECAKENKVDLSVFKPGVKPDPEIFKDRAYKCFGKCVVVKAGFSSEDGEPNYDKLKETLNPPEENMAQIRDCAAENKQADSCDRVFQIHECIMKKIKKE